MGEKKTGQAPKQALAAGWSADELLRMLADPRYLPPPLGLKCDKPAGEDIPGTHKIEVRRVFRQEDQIAYIEKRYLGRYAHRAQYELALLDVVQKIPVVRDHVVGAAGQFHGQNNHGLVLTMRWGGLSVEDWNVLLGEQSPFKTSCVAVLSLVRAVLRACSQFHSMGFVHGDLLLRNVVLPQMTSEKSGWHRLDMSKTRLIDLEFTLAPLTAIKSGSTQSLIPREWFKEKQGDTIWLHPEYHSAQMNPGLFVSQGWRSTKGQRERDWQIPADWYPDADTRLQRVDWGADFFSIANWIELLTSAGNFDDDEAEYDAMRYLLALPEHLRTHDRPIDPTQGEAVPRTPPPHATLILEIDHLIGSHEPDDALSYRLPTPSAAAARPPASPTNLSTWEAGGGTIPDQDQDPSPAPAPASHSKPSTTQAAKPNTPARRWPLGASVAALAVLGAVSGLSVWRDQAPVQDPLQAVASPAAQPSPTPATPTVPTPATALTPQPQPPPPPTPAQQLAAASAALQSHNPGTAPWLSALAHATGLANDAAQTPASRSQFWATVQTNYLQQTQATTQTDWWNKGQPIGAPEQAWLASTQALAAHQLWVAALYQSRAVVGNLPGTKATEAERTQAQNTLAGQASRPTLGPAPALAPAEQTRLQLESAGLLFNRAVYDVGMARRAQQAVPPLPSARLLPLLHTLADLPNPAAQAMLAYTAACLQPQADLALAKAQFARAAQAPATDAQAKLSAQEARARLERLRADPATGNALSPICAI